MSCFSDRQVLCRSAIALTNSGVTMMQRGCHRHAHDTLKSAVGAMKVAFLPNARPIDNDEVKHIKAKVHHAEQYLSKPQQSSSSLKISVVSSDESLSQSPSGMISPIKIEPNDLESVCDLDPDFIASTVLFNFGLAHWVLADESERDHPTLARKLRKACLHLLNLSYELLSTRIKHIYDKDEEDDSQLTKLIFISTIVLSTLSKVYHAFGGLAKAEVYRERMALLQCLLREYQACEQESGSTNAAAA